MAEPDINTVPKLAKRAKADGLPISEYTIRRLIKQGLLPARYFACEDGCDNAPAATFSGSGIRRIDAG